MKYAPFELAIIDLAQRRVRLTVANVAANLRMPPSQVEPHLDRMAAEGRLDVELDEERGVIFYVVRGLTPPPVALAVRPPSYRAPREALPVPHKKKSSALGILFGVLFPGVGLIYAAPFKATVIATIVTIIAVKIFGAVPLFGWLFGSVVLGVFALASGALGALYVRKYNAHGRRTHLNYSALAHSLNSQSVLRDAN